MTDDDLSLLADERLDQYFLVSAEKIALLYAAARIQPGDRVVELGAGAGTVTRSAPPCRTLTAVELDQRLLGTLRCNAPDAVVVQGDALAVVRELPCDVLIGNLPGSVTDDLLDLLPGLSFRTAVLAVGGGADLGRVTPHFEVAVITEVSGPDFAPPQPGVSRIVRITPRT